MSTFGLDFPGLTPGRLLSWLRARRAALAGRSATVRLGLLALAVAGISLTGYLASSALAPAERAYLGGQGRRYSSEDVHKIRKALDKLRIDYQVVDDRRIAVAAGSLDAAGAAVAKLDLGPRTLGDIREESGKASFWESLRDREAREQVERAQTFESLINSLPGVEGSYVHVTRPRQRVLRPTDHPIAFVRLETEGGRELPFSVIDSITSILTTNEYGLTAQAITIMDGSGRRYRDAGNPELNALSSNRAREEDLRRQILDKLDWIRGVRIDVQIAAVEPVESPESKAADAGPASKPNPGAPAPGISVELNRALSIDLEPADPAPTAAPPPAAPKPRGRIMVNVPRSHYYNTIYTPGGHEPSPEDYIAHKERTESHIRKAVEMVVSENHAIAWEPLSLDVIQDGLPIDRAPAEAVAGKSRRWAYDWAAAGAAGAAAAALVAIGTWVFGGRQPARRTGALRGPHRYPRGSPATTPPTERVLEFVRRNPEAAFSVLNRWTSQGGGRS